MPSVDANWFTALVPSDDLLRYGIVEGWGGVISAPVVTPFPIK